MQWKRCLAVSGLVMLVLTGVSCGQKKAETVPEKAVVYIRCYSEEAADTWSSIAGVYRKEHGENIRVLGPEELTKEEGQPAIAVLEEKSDYDKWQKRCMDLSDTRMYSWLLDKKMALKEKDTVTALPCGIRGLGLVYNEELTEKYFNLPDRVVEMESMDEIHTFEELKQVVEDMTARKEELGIDGVFATPYFREAEDGWQTELLNASLSLELNKTEKEQTEFMLPDEFKNVTDLYLDNSCTNRNRLWWKTREDALEEFANGKAVLMQGNDQLYQQISELKEIVVSKKEIRYLPLAMGFSQEAGLYLEADDYLCINGETSSQNQKAAVAFLEWLYETDQGKEYVRQDLGYTAPYATFSEEDIPSDPLAWDMITAVENQKTQFVWWDIDMYEAKEQEKQFVQSLSEYARTLKTWEEVSEEIKEELQSPPEELKRKNPDGWMYQPV